MEPNEAANGQQRRGTIYDGYPNQQQIVQFQNIQCHSEMAESSSQLVLVPKHSDDPNRDEDLLFLLDPCTKVSTVSQHLGQKNQIILQKESRVPINSYGQFFCFKTIPQFPFNFQFVSNISRHKNGHLK